MNIVKNMEPHHVVVTLLLGFLFLTACYCEEEVDEIEGRTSPIPNVMSRFM